VTTTLSDEETVGKWAEGSDSITSKWQWRSLCCDNNHDRCC